MKTAEINIHLFGKPEQEIDIDNAKPKDFKNLGEKLKERLKIISEIIERLEKNGWKRYGGLYDIRFYKNITKEKAKNEMKKLNISEDDIDIYEESVHCQ